MKKALRIFTAILLVTAVLSSTVACTAPQKLEIEDNVTVYLRTGAICSKEDAQTTKTWEFDYDSAGNLLLVSGRDSDGTEFYHSESKYDNNSNILSAIFFYDRLKEEETPRYEYEYTDNGSKEITYFGDTLYCEEIYDHSGKTTSLTKYYSTTSRHSDYKYEYDSNGNITLMVIYEEGIEKERETYKYDNNGNLILKVTYGTGVETETEKYEYDQNGRKTLYIHLQNGDETRYEYKYECDSSGNVIAENHYCNGELSDHYEYDHNGVKKLDVHYNNGEVFSRTDYDENGCPTQYARGSVIYTFKYRKITLSRQQAEKAANQTFMNIAFFVDLPIVVISE